jgi:hypothetical protein
MLVDLLEAAGRTLAGARLEVAPAPAGQAGVSVRLLVPAGSRWEPSQWWPDAEGGTRTWTSVQAGLEDALDLAEAARDCPALACWPAPITVVVALQLAEDAPAGLALDGEGRPVAWVV